MKVIGVNDVLSARFRKYPNRIVAHANFKKGILNKIRRFSCTIFNNDEIRLGDNLFNSKGLESLAIRAIKHELKTQRIGKLNNK